MPPLDESPWDQAVMLHRWWIYLLPWEQSWEEAVPHVQQGGGVDGGSNSHLHRKASRTGTPKTSEWVLRGALLQPLLTAELFVGERVSTRILPAFGTFCIEFLLL